jgi:RND family efflux transporter MFP subunit
MACCAAAAPAPANAPGLDDGSLPSNVFPGHTAPKEKRAQNFDLPGVVDKVLVKEGDKVKAGDLLAQQDTSVDEAHLESLKIVAESDLEIKAEDAQLAKDIVDRDRKQKLASEHAISPADYEESKLAVTIDEFKLQKAREDKKRAAFDLKEQTAKIERKKLMAKVDGIVEEINTHEGELANSDSQHPTITVVQNDTVYIEVDMPAEAVKKLQLKQPLQVRYKDEDKWREAAIHFIRPEADPQSNFEHVQLEMPNTEARRSGLQVLVKLPDNLAAGGAAGVEANAK